MPAKKRSKRKPAAKSARKTRKRALSAKNSRTPKKRVARKHIARRPKATGGSAESELKRAFQSGNPGGKAALSPQTEDLQGLSRAEEADSESVEELAGEGNVFEAGAVAGVEEADSSDESEAHTHELPEDDVPEEYLDKD